MLTAGSAVRAAAAGTGIGADRRLRWWVEILLGLALFGVYLLVHSWPLPGHVARAMANGEAILAFERALHTDFELPMNLWLADTGWLRVVANYEYAFTYIVTTLVVLVWLFLRRPRVYRWARDSFALLNLFALVCFWLYPVAPPRLLPGAGFVDTVRLSGTWGSWGSPMVDNANQFAAMPSLHIGWAVWVSVVLARIASGWLAQLASAVHVLVTFLVIIATGNHYWLDAVGGVLVVWLGVAGAGLRGHPQDTRSAPERWTTRANVGRLLLLEARRIEKGAAGTKGANCTDLVWLRQRVRGLVLADHRRAAGPGQEQRPEPDWSWHLPEYDLTGKGEQRARATLYRIAADLVARPLPPDRPPWRCALVSADGVAAVVPIAAPAPGSRAGDGADPAAGGQPRRLRLTVVGLPERAVCDLAAAHRARASEVLLCAVTGALAGGQPDILPDPVRVWLADREGGVPVDVPLRGLLPKRRLAVLAGTLGARPCRAEDAGVEAELAGPRWCEPPVPVDELPVSVAVPLVAPGPDSPLGLGAQTVDGTLWVGLLIACELVGDVDRFETRLSTELAKLGLHSRRG
ncbi:hypothetical protein FHU38_002092 [Saccharomonospora amisosensis]|uniref:Inositolphosphotransferase Aur1/Ipt1 domain-containing protein n=1 Tax=Saccharomonospora amisosensis TaxID=1128677 RepID=A0A7X5UPC2_9PSEU|nr:hypothetical protein [Saccharomonospora amisosensis]